MAKVQVVFLMHKTHLLLVSDSFIEMVNSGLNLITYL